MSNPNTRLAELRSLLAKATAGPWIVRADCHTEAYLVDAQDGDGIAWVEAEDGMTILPAEANAALIVAAVNALPNLIAEVERLREALAAVKLVALSFPGEAKPLARIIRLTIDAGISAHLPELQSSATTVALAERRAALTETPHA